MINHLVDVALLEDRIIVRGPEGVVDLPLAYQIHSRLIQTGELARLIAEHLRDDHGDDLPPLGSRVRLALPLHWGLVCLRLPYAGVSGLRQPLHQMAWELDCNAPEQAEQYLFDFHETAVADPEGSDTVGGTLVMAVRQNLVQFCQTLAEELGWVLAELIPAGKNGQGHCLDLARAMSHQKGMAGEQFAPVTHWRGLALAMAAIVAIAGLSGWLMLRDHEGKPPALQQATVPADSLRAAIGQPAHASDSSAGKDLIVAAGPSLEAWTTLLQQLARHEGALPDYLVLDADGILVRLRLDNKRRLTDLLERPSRVSRVSPTFYWVAFNEPLPGGLLVEDPSLPVIRISLGSLAELPGRLTGPLSRLILQRRRAEGVAGGTAWLFENGVDQGQPRGWQATLFRARLPHAGVDLR